MKTKKISTNKLAGLSVLTALSILMALIKFPVLPMVPFLEYDFADIPIFIATFMYGPLAGLLVTIIASTIEGLSVAISSGPMGIIMHIIATGSYIIVAGNIYKRHHNFKGAIVSLICGSLTAILIMIPFNILITPLFMAKGQTSNLPQMRKVIYGMLGYIVAFNIIRFTGNSILTLLLYKKTHKLFDTVGKKYGKKEDNLEKSDIEDLDIKDKEM